MGTKAKEVFDVDNIECLADKGYFDPAVDVYANGNMIVKNFSYKEVSRKTAYLMWLQ